MRRLFLFCTILILVSFGYSQTRLINTKNLEYLDVEQLVANLAEYDVLFFGEWHGNKELHKMQKELSSALLKSNRKVVFSFEMWERDTQELLNMYVAGKLDEKSFLNESRAWENFEDYKPMLIMAQDNNLKAIAANIPRSYASRIAREGWEFVDELPPSQRRYIAQSFSAPEDDYRNNFYSLMQNMSGHEITEESLERLYKAQCIKDDTMAESIAAAIRNNPQHKLVHFNGDFHSRSYLGTVSRLQKLMPELKIAVLSPESVEDITKPDLSEDIDSVANFILLIQNEKNKENK